MPRGGEQVQSDHMTAGSAEVRWLEGCCHQEGDVLVAGRVLSSGGMYGAGGSSMEHAAITAVVGALVRHPRAPMGDKSYAQN
jgi:phage baseplate assembly protein gpV